ncbi:MAG TPA: hypothetical protein VKZ63_01215 [Kofleriaceae bacterium]|nr:hypothetical protein [Kofleriaceae bacterium]
MSNSSNGGSNRNNQKPTPKAPGNKPAAPQKPRKKLQLDVSDVETVLERKISP